MELIICICFAFFIFVGFCVFLSTNVIWPLFKIFVGFICGVSWDKIWIKDICHECNCGGRRHVSKPTWRGSDCLVCGGTKYKNRVATFREMFRKIGV